MRNTSTAKERPEFKVRKIVGIKKTPSAASYGPSGLRRSPRSKIRNSVAAMAPSKARSKAVSKKGRRQEKAIGNRVKIIRDIVFKVWQRPQDWKPTKIQGKRGTIVRSSKCFVWVRVDGMPDTKESPLKKNKDNVVDI